MGTRIAVFSNHCKIFLKIYLSADLSYFASIVTEKSEYVYSFYCGQKNKRYLTTRTKYRSFCCLGILFGSYPMFSTLDTVILEATRTASSLLLRYVPALDTEQYPMV